MKAASLRQHLYPWLICFCCLLLIFCTVGLGANVMPVYFPFLRAEHGFSNTEIAVITILRSGLACVGMGLAPSFIRRLSCRALALCACLLETVALLLMSRASTLLLLYSGAACTGLAYGLGSMVLASVLVRQWFRQRESFALGLCAAGSGLANAIASPLITAAIEKWGLTTSFVLEAGAIALIGLLLLAIIRDEPARLGLLPHGAATTAEAAEAGAAVQEKAVPEDSPAESAPALTRRQRGLMLIAMLITGPANITSLSLTTLHYTNGGYPAMTVAAALAVFGLVLTVSKLLYGWVTDRLGVYLCNWLFLGLLAISNLLTAVAVFLPPGSLIFILLIMNALGYPPMMIGMSLWARDLWPRAEYTQAVARFQQLTMLGGMIGSLLAGVSADVTGGYTAAYAGIFVLLSFSLLSIQYLYRVRGCGWRRKVR